MNETNDALWLAFETLASTYPPDIGVQMTADLARWLVEEGQRQQLTAQPTLEKVVCTTQTMIFVNRQADYAGSPEYTQTTAVIIDSCDCSPHSRKYVVMCCLPCRQKHNQGAFYTLRRTGHRAI